MKPHQMKEQFLEVERSVSHAATACEHSREAPGTLRRRLSEWSRQCQALRTAIETEGDPERIRDALDELEHMAERLVRVCRRIAVDDEVEQAVEHAHAALSELHHRLH